VNRTQNIHPFRSAGLLLVVALLLAVTGSALSASPAAAAAKAYGFQGGTGAGAGWLGNVSTHGLLAYCVDEAGVFPSGTTSNDGFIGGITATSSSSDPGHNGTVAVAGSDMQKLNYALSKYGQVATSDRKAAALEAYVYSITSTLYPGNAVEQVIDIRVTDSADAAAVTNDYLAIKTDVDAHYAAPVQANSASLSIAMDPVPALTGTITVSVKPSTATGSLTLTNAVFTATGSTTIPVHDGDVIPITATQLTGNDLYSVQADATFTAPTTYSKDLNEYTTSSPDYSQRVVTGGKLKDATFTATTFAIDPLVPQFEPTLSTAVTDQSIDPGTPENDVLTASVADPTKPWLRDLAGAYVPVIARGTLYCGMSAYPVTGNAVPDGVLSKDPELLTLDGPGTYTTDGSLSCPTGGYATWVWSILVDDQPPLTRQGLPTDYSWSSMFGEPTETTFVRASVAASTQVSASITGLRQPTSDLVSVRESEGDWPSDSTGGAANVHFDGTAYWIPGDAEPNQSGTVPPDAEAFATGSITATATGDYPGPTVSPPFESNGFVVWQWIAAGGDYTMPWTEDFAEPTQIISVVAPTLSSVADTQIAFTDSASDSVAVAGETMGEPADLTWAAYLKQPAAPVICDAAAKVFDSSASPVEVMGAGNYTVPSPPRFADPGIYAWVATLAGHDGTVIAQGECGDPTEITDVVRMGLTTAAVTIAPTGAGVGDNATITGPVPAGATLSFAAFRQTTSVPRCDKSTLVYASAASPLTAPGHVQSPTATLPRGRYDWTATAFDRDGNVLLAGECGDPAEATRVVSVLAYTGQTALARAPWVAAGLVLLGAGALLFSWRRRVRQLVHA
jgi:hypothetical protein